MHDFGETTSDPGRLEDNRRGASSSASRKGDGTNRAPAVEDAETDEGNVAENADGEDEVDMDKGAVSKVVKTTSAADNTKGMKFKPSNLVLTTL